MSNFKFSVVMPCLLNRPEHKQIVEDCIASVRKNSKDYELIIIDDGSPLPTDFLKEQANTYIRHNPKNKGIAPSWNDGINIARGEYIVIINDDITVPENWLEDLATGFEYTGTGVAAPAVQHVPHPQVGVQELKTWFPGYCFMLKRSVIEEMKAKEEKTTLEEYPGIFDEQFVPFNGEDCDYWERLSLLGYKMMRVWKVEIWHAEGDVLHHMDYQNRSDEAIKQFIKKHKFDPRLVYYH